VYEPRVTTVIDPSTGVTGTKSAEILLLPERAGAVEVPPLGLAFFDPDAEQYTRAVAPGFTLRATATAGAAAAGGPAGTAAPAAGEDAHAENVIADDIRPIRTRGLGRQVGTGLVHTRGFGWLLGFPPLLLVLALAGVRAQERRLADTEGRRQRLGRQRARGHLSAAEAHRRRHETGPFFAELERVVYVALEARIGRSGRGLSTEELRAALGASGVPPEVSERLVETLETCDRARFAPGTLGDPEGLMDSLLRQASGLLDALGGPPARTSGDAGAAGKPAARVVAP
jgi:hypothetical protein